MRRGRLIGCRVRALSDAEPKFIIGTSKLPTHESRLEAIPDSASSAYSPLLPVACRWPEAGGLWGLGCRICDLTLIYCKFLNPAPIRCLRLKFLQTRERGLDRGGSSAPVLQHPRQGRSLYPQLHKDTLPPASDRLRNITPDSLSVRLTTFPFCFCAFVLPCLASFFYYPPHWLEV